MTMTISRLEELLRHENMEEILGIEDDGCRPEIRQLSDREEIVDYHGKTRRIKIRYKLYPEAGRDQWSFLKGPVFEIMHFCVSPQNFGYGTKFISHLIKHFQQEDIKSIVLHATNSRAARFWSRVGFIPHPLANNEELLMYRVINFDKALSVLPVRSSDFRYERQNRSVVMHH